MSRAISTNTTCPEVNAAILAVEVATAQFGVADPLFIDAAVAKLTAAEQHLAAVIKHGGRQPVAGRDDRASFVAASGYTQFLLNLKIKNICKCK